MRLRNGPHGYGLATKVLHWLTVAALIAQFGVGLTMEADDAAFAAKMPGSTSSKTSARRRPSRAARPARKRSRPTSTGSTTNWTPAKTGTWGRR